VEYAKSFVQQLRKRFTQLDIVHGNAADLCQLVPPGRRVSAIVSSLPLCSLPPAVTRRILQQWQVLLEDGGIAVQFTYHLRTPHWRRYIEPTETRSKIVWANIPPANVTTFSFCASRQGASAS
jgi:phospholipid N-methyltransferase